MNTQYLLAQIAAAFPVEPVPAKNNLLYPEAYSENPELEEIKEFFGGRSWQVLTAQDIFRFRHAYTFFSPTAGAYYIAAWLTCSLAYPNEVDTAIEDLVFDLGRADPELWTQPQRCIICEWLHHFEEVPLKERLQTALANLGCDEKRLGP